MRIVVRNSPGHVLAGLTEREAMALRAWYGNSSTEDDERIALAAIKRAKTMDGWIECDCVSGRFRPLLAPIQQEKTFTLRRLTPKDGDPNQHEDRPNHADTCPFHVDPDDTPALFDRGYNIRPVPRPDRTYVDALPAIPDRLADISAPASERTVERNDRPSKLGMVLWRLMDKAGTNVIPPLQDRPEFSLSNQVSKVRNAAREFKVLRTWTLGALTSTWAADYFTPASRWQELLDKSRPDWPDNLRRTGFMLLFSTSVSANAIAPASNPRKIEVHSKVRQPLRGDPASRGPFLTILNADFQENDQGPIRAIQAYAQPVYNGDTLFPVESGFERDVAHLLFWLQRSLFEAAPQLRIKIVKPLFAWEAPSGACRPDFVLETTYGNYEPVNLIVEAFGMDTEGYRAAKDKTVPRMREIGPLFEIRPEDISKAKAEETGRRLQQWVLQHSRRTAARNKALFNQLT
ncbi:hypothetical protein [Sinorhizobium meliloti]|uniref:DUF1173 family protein n=1 Tax=Rhizobium meliloti TaxID=382 RepID=A0A2J0YX02_RHIML|nr:hypothetical protein [Sinorhizobium meliloti]PJR12800.1 hypothetical protein CEJ86_24805 [Sinorhizobium meliloti]